MRTKFYTLATIVAMLTAVLSANAQDVKMRTVGNVEMVVSYALDQLCDYPNQWRNSEWREKWTLILETDGGRAHSYVVEEQNNRRGSARRTAGDWILTSTRLWARRSSANRSRDS